MKNRKPRTPDHSPAIHLGRVQLSLLRLFTAQLLPLSFIFSALASLIYLMLYKQEQAAFGLSDLSASLRLVAILMATLGYAIAGLVHYRMYRSGYPLYQNYRLPVKVCYLVAWAGSTLSGLMLARIGPPLAEYIHALAF